MFKNITNDTNVILSTAQAVPLIESDLRVGYGGLIFHCNQASSLI